MPRDSQQQADYSRAVRERIRGSRFPAGSRPPAPKPLRPRTVKPAPAKRERTPPPRRSRFHDITPTAALSGPLDVLANYLTDEVRRGDVVVIEDGRVAMERCLSGLSPDQLHELWETRHVNAHGYHLQYIPRRHLRIRGVGTVYDTQALTLRMKAQPYAARLAIVEEVCRDLGIKPHTYDGLGPLAAAWLGKHEVHRLNWQADAGMEDRFARAYYGGRVEAMQHGAYSGTVYHYDIASAYPWAMTRTPRMGPRWEQTAQSDPEAVLFKLRWRATPQTFYPLPFRQADGSLCWPREGEGYVWEPEYRQCIGTDTDVVEAWRPAPHPYQGSYWEWPLHSAMRTLYHFREMYEATDRPDHAALVKGIMQACFGKAMQQWGGLPGRMHNLAWAGYATSVVRAELYALMQTDPAAIIAAQTDAIWSTRPLDVPPWFGGLGRWRETVHEAGPHHFAPTAGQYALADGTEGHMGLSEPIAPHQWPYIDAADQFQCTRVQRGPVSLGWAVANCDGRPHTCAERLGTEEIFRESIPARATGKRFTTDRRIGGLWQTEAAVVRGESAAYDSRWTSGEHERDYTASLLLDDLSDGGGR